MISTDDIRWLATADHAGPVLSVILRTDAREAADTGATPAWRVALRDGLQEIERRVGDSDRDERLALRQLRDEVQRELAALPAEERGRGVAWFMSGDRSLDRHFTLRLPPSGSLVRWDARPYVLPLVELADRGELTAVVLVGLDAVRLVAWEQGQIAEPADSVYDLELGDWRKHAAYAAADPASGQRTATDTAEYRERVRGWRERFHLASGERILDRLAELRSPRVVIAGERRLTEAFRRVVPRELARRVRVEDDANLVAMAGPKVAARLEPHILAARSEHAQRTAKEVVERARAGHPAALTADDTLPALAIGRARHLVLDPAHGFALAGLGEGSAALLRGRGDDTVAEVAVELALRSGAAITTASVADEPLLAHADGMAATLRH